MELKNIVKVILLCLMCSEIAPYEFHCRRDQTRMYISKVFGLAVYEDVSKRCRTEETINMVIYVNCMIPSIKLNLNAIKKSYPQLKQSSGIVKANVAMLLFQP